MSSESKGRPRGERPLKFGLTCGFQNPPRWARPFAELYRITLDQLVLAEQLGFDSVWVQEHHFTEDGFCPSVLPVCAALATRTSRVTIGTRVLLLPLHDPVRVAEDAAVVDILSNGRFQLGVAAGYRVEEFEAFGVDRRERGGRMEEAVQVIQRAWTEERFSFEGRYYRYRDLAVTPKPVQSASGGRPPIWMGGRAEPAMRRAARLGCNFLINGIGEPSHVYTSALREYGHDPADFELMGNLVAYVHQDPEQAWQDVREHLLYQRQFLGRSYGDARDLPGDDRLMVDDPEQIRRGPLLVGTPEQVVADIRRYRAMGPFDHLALWMQLPGLDPDRVACSMELFAREVIPQFRS